MSAPIYLNNDTQIKVLGTDKVTGVKDVNGVLLTGATVQVTFTDVAGLALAGIVWPQSLTETPASSAIYVTTIDSANLTAVQNGMQLKIVVTINSAGKTATFTLERTFRVRKAA